ncbi:MAG TPA: HNH endonuclease signature motif containing protein [Candidatus Acidoferrum sp.]|jgi:hypothetical protein|nr:HNH endonuclease signature motif containing protein [Candidatus Acidoferrum sp.]
MTTAPPTVPSPSAVPNPLKHLPSLILHSAWNGIWAAATTSPIFAALLILAVAGAVIGFVRAIIHGGHARDSIRRFPRADKAFLLARAGGRCEHHVMLLGRCRETERLEADHIHPWSRGGQTAIANGQALCRRHNRAKRAAIPYGWQLRALEKQRASYYPAGQSGAVSRRAARTRPRGGQPTPLNTVSCADLPSRTYSPRSD